MTAFTQEPKLRVLGIRDQDLRFWNGQSWVYDEVESCWRGVDQPIVPPPGTPTPVDKLDVGFTTPDAGWVYMKVAGPAQDVTIPLSNSFDAFEDLVRWLEAILDGGSPRYMINTEGSLDEFHLFSADRDRLRFVIAYVHYDPPAVPTRRLALDVLISRRALLRSFSEPFHDYWHGDELKKHWTEWVFDLKNPDEAPFVPERLREPSDTLTWRLRAFLGHR